MRDAVPRPRNRRARCRDPHCRWNRLLDDDQIGGLLGRIRAVAYLIAVASDLDPGRVRATGWLLESLAEEAQGRLQATVGGAAHRGCQTSQRPV